MNLHLDKDSEVNSFHRRNSETENQPVERIPKASKICFTLFLILCALLPTSCERNTGSNNNGTLVAWGAGGPRKIGFAHAGQTTIPADLSGVTAIAAGGEHSIAVTSNGAVIVAWGTNDA